MILQRDPFGAFGTTGMLQLNGEKICSLERPWIPTDPGGKPYDSCVPAGLYRLTQHRRPSGTVSFALINRGLGVFHHERHRKMKVGRFLILIHPANYVDELMGCIAPGMKRTNSDLGPTVSHSRFAMSKIVDFDPQELLILDSH